MCSGMLLVDGAECEFTNYSLRRRCELNDIITVIMGFVETGPKVQMYKLKGKANIGTRTTW